MKTISFSALEILPALLDKSKTQTIRPVILKKKPLPSATWITDADLSKKEYNSEDCFIKTPSRFKVGEKVKFYWKQRSKLLYKWCCAKCGGPITHTHEFGIGWSSMECEKCSIIFNGKNKEYCVFFRIFGTGTITEVFEIEMSKNKIEVTKGNALIYTTEKLVGKIPPVYLMTDVIAKEDGFNSAEDMFEWFDKQYDLSTPKRFYVYRWKWD